MNRYVTKPGDTFTARAIGTYPELPDPSLDDREYDPQFWAEHTFEGLPEGVSSLITYGGPLGVVVVELKAGVFTHYRDRVGGAVLRRSVWNPATMSWDVEQ